MPHVALVKDAAGDPACQILYSDLIRHGFGAAGAPLNFFTAQGARPDILAAVWHLVRTMLVDGRLPPALKQMIILAISRQADCRYCEVVHGHALEQMGVDRATIDQCAADPTAASLPATHREILKFAVRAARDPDSVDAAAVEALRDLGLDEGEVVEVLMMVAFTRFVNTWATVSGIPTDM
ncbi:MAG: carboxymuconolactone decarboxylase family protein [Myxococcales bacterium]|nr:carboxymuconolactone decarboxylase family protein [Myxococcales bacterium]